jgi:hypothetical protein
MINVLTFRLRDGVDEAEFIAADARLQVEFANLQAGMVRRTTARGEDGGWAVITLWASAEAAEAVAAASGDNEIVAGFLALIDRDTLAVSQYHELEG